MEEINEDINTSLKVTKEYHLSKIDPSRYVARYELSSTRGTVKKLMQKKP